MKCKVINTSKKMLEQEVNSWLETGKYEITEILQTEDANMGYITLTIFYLDKQEVRKKKFHGHLRFLKVHFQKVNVMIKNGFYYMKEILIWE